MCFHCSPRSLSLFSQLVLRASVMLASSAMFLSLPLSCFKGLRNRARTYCSGSISLFPAADGKHLSRIKLNEKRTFTSCSTLCSLPAYIYIIHERKGASWSCEIGTADALCNCYCRSETEYIHIVSARDSAKDASGLLLFVRSAVMLLSQLFALPLLWVTALCSSFIFPCKCSAE